MVVSKEIQISNYINSGLPNLSDFKVITKDLHELNHNEILVKNLWMTVDPYMRGRLINRSSYISPFKLNTALEGSAIGIIEESKNNKFTKGDIVFSSNGWREYFISNGSDLEKLNKDTQNISNYLGVLGMPGLTAYASLLTIGKPKDGETVFVSAAAGAVGSLVCQIAKLKGCKVIASVGSKNKIAWLNQHTGVDAVFNYKETSNINLTLHELAPHGIDIYFDNVGGEHLEAAINNMNKHGRIIMCGMISQYNLENPEPGPNNLFLLIVKQLTMQGFLVFDYDHLKPDFYKEMSTWLKNGEIKTHETILEGIDNAPNAFLNLFSGDNIGKMLVKL